LSTLPSKNQPSPGAVVIGTVLFLLLLQFTIVPGLGSMDQVGKGLVATCCVPLLVTCACWRSPRWRYSPLAGVGLLLLGVFLLGSSASDHPFNTLFAVGYLATLLLLTLLVTHLAATEVDFPAILIGGLALTGTIAAGLGFYEYITYAIGLRSRTMLIPYLLPPDTSSRVGGMFGQPNLFALFLTLSLLGCSYWYLRQTDLPGPCWVFRLRFIPVTLVSTVLLLTGSRAGLLSLLLVTSLLCWLVLRGRYLAGETRRRREALRLLAAVVIGLALGYLITRGYFRPTGISMASSVADKFQEVSGYNFDSRFLFWATAIAIFLANPWLGIGLDNFKYACVSFRLEGQKLLGFGDPQSFAYSNWAHNELLQLLCEGGVIGILPILFLLYLYLRVLYKRVLTEPATREDLFLFSHLFPLPFLVQSMLGWPLRHSSLLVLFFAFIGLLLAQYPLRQLPVGRVTRLLATSLLAVALLGTIPLWQQELALGRFFRDHRDGPGTLQKLAALQEVSSHPFTELRALARAVPHFRKKAMEADDEGFARGLLPFAERLVALREHEGSWLDVALLAYRLGERERADFAVQRAIDLKPNYGTAWSFQHYLHMLDAAKKTGRPIEEFFPNPPGERYQIPEMFHVGNRTRPGHQDLQPGALQTQDPGGH